MSATKTPQREKRKQSEAEIAVNGAGQWICRNNGKFFDPKRKMWILKCHGCGKPFYAKRVDAKTHSEACRKKVSRRNLKGQS